MELAPCPKCGAFSGADAKECSQCHAPLDAEPEAGSSPPIGLAPIDTPPAPPPAPAPFDAPPEVQAKVAELEADIAHKPGVAGFSLQLSKIYVEANRKDLAIAALERLLAVDPSNAYVRHKHAQLIGVPETAAHPSASAGVAAARGAARSGHTAPFVAGVAQRPTSAPVPDMMRRMSARTKAIVGGSLAFVLAVTAAKVWLFPDTKVLVRGDFRAYGSSWSPTGEHLAFLLDDGRSTRLAVYDFRAGSYRPLAPASAWDARGFSWSPDGTKIAYTAPAGGDDGGEAVHVVDVASGQSRRLAAGSAPLWSAGGTILMTCGPEGPPSIDEGSYTEIDWTPRFCTVDAATGEARRGAAVAEYGVTVSPLLDKALSESHEETASASAEPASADDEGEFQDLAQSVAESGPRNVAQGSRNLSRELQARQYTERRRAGRGVDRLPYAGDVIVTDIGSGNAVSVTSDGQSAYPSWTPDGSRILFATNGASGIEMWTMNADGGDRRLMVPGSLKVADPSSVALSNDGRDVFFIAPVPGDPGVAKIMTGESPADLHVVRAGENAARRLSNRHPFKQRFAVSPDGKRIAYEVRQAVTMLGGAQKSEIWLLKR